MYSILEVLKLLKENQAREAAKEEEKRLHKARKEQTRHNREQSELDAIRSELREWEMKREELAAANKDPGNQAGMCYRSPRMST